MTGVAIEQPIWPGELAKEAIGQYNKMSPVSNDYGREYQVHPIS
jgi:hypothetical protein